MAWRNIFISSPAKLSLLQNNLLIHSGGEDLTVPLEDIAIVVLENTQTTLTGQILSEFSQRGISLLLCDGRHLPCGELLPYHRHSRLKKTVTEQLELTVPFKKNCWRLIVRQKLLNQARCLDLLWLPFGDELRRLAADVKSGDPDNKEAQGAQIYFEQIMPSITRRTPATINDALNYGYSIMRAAMARALVAYGFIPVLGLFHRSELNQFNLADDFVEVMRPLVDLWVVQNIEHDVPFLPRHRHSLVGLLSNNLLVDGEKQTVLRATEIMSSSFRTACTTKNPSSLVLPELLPLVEHRYE